MTAGPSGPIAEGLSRRVQVVAGKGGVGRTLIACGIAVRSARSGQRTLLLEVNAPDDAASALGVAPAVDEPREVMNGLWLCRMTPPGSLREYALLVLKFKALYTLVFENRLVKYLLRSIPALAEFTMLGKTWYHFEERGPDGHRRFDRIVVDAPATGHAITFLALARTVARISPAGVMKDAAEKMADMVESKKDTCIHVVALPEEMPVNEGLEIIDAARGRLNMAPGLAVVNRVLSPLFQEAELGIHPALAQKGAEDPQIAPWVTAASRRLDREAWQSENVQRYRAESGMPSFEVPDFGACAKEERLERVIELLDRVSETALPSAKASDA